MKRIGIVGAGGISRAHGNAAKQLDDATITAVCDLNREAADRYGDEFDVKNRYALLADMLDAEELDVAIICVWGVLHAEVGVQIAESKAARAILCEKPFTSTATEAIRFVDACARNDVLVAEAFKFRHHPRQIKAKELIDSGEIGELSTLRSTFCIASDAAGRQPANNWRWNKSQGGGSIYDLACYNIHHARFIFGADPVTVFASEQRGVEVDEAATMLFVFPNGGTAQISVGWTSWSSEYVEIGGTGGLIRMEKAWNCGGQPTSLELHNRDGAQTLDFPPADQFALQLRHLCDCLDTGAPHRVSPQNSVGQMKTIDAVFKSMATGKSVELA